MSAPSAVPSLADMPSTESVPACEYDAGPGPCGATAALRLTIHVDKSDHGNFTFLSCAAHWDEYREFCEWVLRQPDPVCAGCLKPFRHLHDLVLSVIPL